MRGSIHAALQTIRGFWFAVTGQESAAGEGVSLAARLHDPAADEPHDLDDPYFDPNVQRRFADVISHSVRDRR